ncbi:hypothetical protein B0H16DRAFT_1447973 [Mycena metata]|uniref:Uncharacterized protein n=1 Tax=Mycena metata TaxID=1033252 RepID=A0AAD7KAJ0_9AGAR|nr:hypothetical protein B0H16DRAFT_1447973 [Mycena metata]
MRASVSIYEDPEPKSEADVWADGESRTTLYIFLAVSFAATSTIGYIAYSLLGSGRGLGALIFHHDNDHTHECFEARTHIWRGINEDGQALLRGDGVRYTTATSIVIVLQAGLRNRETHVIG